MTHRNRQGRRDPARARGAVAAGAPLVRIDPAGRCTIGPAAILPFVPAPAAARPVTWLQLAGAGETGRRALAPAADPAESG